MTSSEELETNQEWFILRNYRSMVTHEKSESCLGGPGQESNRISPVNEAKLLISSPKLSVHFLLHILHVCYFMFGNTDMISIQQQ
jgi:hypothetical protein